MPSVSKMMNPQVTSTRMASNHCTRVNGRRSTRAAMWPWMWAAPAATEPEVPTACAMPFSPAMRHAPAGVLRFLLYDATMGWRGWAVKSGLRGHALFSGGEVDTLVQFRQRQFDVDLRHAQDSVGAQQVTHPIGADTFEHGAGHLILGEHDIAADTHDAGVFLVLRDEVPAGAIVAQHFEDDDRIVDPGCASYDRRANDETIGIADLFAGIVLPVVAVEPTWLAT